MRDAIRALRPQYVIIENVPGLATKMGSRPGESALGTVIADLAEAGYVGSWLRLRASDVGAPHKRERIFLVATNTECLRVDADAGVRGGSAETSGRSAQEAVLAGTQVALTENALSDSASSPAYTERQRQYRIRGSNTPGETGVWEDWRPVPKRPSASAADSDSGRLASIREPEPADLEGEGGDVTDGRDREGEEASAADSDSERRSEYGGSISVEKEVATADGDSERREWGIYAPAVLRWERELGRSAPRPTDDRGRLNPEFTGWMLGFPEGWVEGENRTQQLRMLGNAVQVQCGEVIGRMILGS